MYRVALRAFLLSTLLVGTLAGSVEAQRDFGAVEIRATKLADGLYMLQGAGGNLAVSVGSDGVVLIDDQFAPLTEKILAAIRVFSDQPVRYVINTHWHGDHVGGNDNLGKAGAIIVAHENVRQRMSVEQFQALRGRTLPASPHSALPVITFRDSVSLHLNGKTLRAFHVPPAHTDGDSIIHFAEADVIHMGDTFFNGSYPFVDVDSNGSIAGMIAAQEQILSMAGPKTRIIPGHGPLSDAEGLRAAHDMLVTLRDRVEQAIAAGVSADDFVASDPLADLNAKWGGGFLKPEQVLRIIYADLSRP